MHPRPDGTEAPAEHPPSLDRAAVTVARFRAVISVATAMMFVLSWPLWVDSTEIPRVPFVRGWPEPHFAFSWVIFALLLVGLVVSATGALRGLAYVAGLLGIGFLVLGDQHRFQPWVYQYLMIGLLLASLSPSRAVAGARWWFASLYVYSGLSKLDRSFCDEMGMTFLRVLVKPIGLTPDAWSPGMRLTAVLAMPVAEIMLGAALLFRRTRRAGLAGVLLLHATLLWILGPWGLGHSAIVLVWNAAMMLEVLILFGGPTHENPAPYDRLAWRSWPVMAILWAGMILPLGERLGLCDAWPAHALYASHVERTLVDLHEEELALYPSAVQRHTSKREDGPWRRLDLTGWSREVRGVPEYPQGRACNGLAEGLAARYGGRRLIRVVQWRRAARFTGQRTRTELFGLEAIRRYGDRYWLNAHPAGAHLSDHVERTD